MSAKKHGFPDYSHINEDDIRTIPDFYDNLYPSNDSQSEFTNSISTRQTKNIKKTRNNKKIKENTSKN